MKIYVPNYLPIIGMTDIRTLIEHRYELGRKVCFQIYDNPRDRQSFEDLYHTTLYNAIKCLDRKRMDQDEMILYFMRAYRNNLIRQYKYAYRKLQDDVDLEGMLICSDEDESITTHMDGWGMIEMVRSRYGQEMADALLEQMNGFTYETISRKHGMNAFYELGKIKNFLKRYYSSTPQENDSFRYDEKSGLWLRK